MANSYQNIPVPTPTQNPVPSADIRDHVFAGSKLDEFVTSMGWTYTDRFGGKHYTIEGLRWLAQQAISQYGYITLDSFETGNTITLPNQVLRLETTGEYYRWDGALPKEVPAGSTPESTGGVGTGAWIGVGDAALRTELTGIDGSSLVGAALYSDIRSYSGNNTRINCIGRLNIFDGAHGIFYLDNTDTASEDNDGTILIDALDRRWKRATDGDVYSKWFGAIGDGITDDTLALRNAFKAATGGRLNVSSGDYVCSLETSPDNNVALWYYQNTEYVALGDVTIRLVNEDLNSGKTSILLANYGYDSEEVVSPEGVFVPYSAAGNVKFRGFKFSTADTLIAFGNAQYATFEGCGFYNWHLHAIDMARSRKVRIEKFIAYNEDTYRQAAAFQIDKDNIVNIAGNPTNCTNIYIGYGELTCAAENAIHMHSGNYSQNITVEHITYNSLTEGPVDPANPAGIYDSCFLGCDADVSINNLRVNNCTINLNYGTARGINIVQTTTGASIQDVWITKNKFTGKGRIALYFGGPALDDLSIFNTRKDLYIEDNSISIDGGESSSATSFIRFTRISNIRFDNNIVTYFNSAASQFFMELIDVPKFRINDNDLRVSGSNSSGAMIRVTPDTLVGLGGTFSFHMYRNEFRTDNSLVNSHIFINSPSTDVIYNGLGKGYFGGNTFRGSVSLRNFVCPWPVYSDGNNFSFVNFGSSGMSNDPTTLNIQQGSSYTGLSLPYTLDTTKSGITFGAFSPKFDFMFSASETGIINGAEQINNDLANSIGTIIKDVRSDNGTFSIVTGGSGVSKTLNTITNAVTTRSSGYLKIKISY
ncbi:TPA: hypothetical protein OPR08_000039 [Citrobacter koseri]|nr:hypothetical protein [Citrobacter koseri]